MCAPTGSDEITFVSSWGLGCPGAATKHKRPSRVSSRRHAPAHAPPGVVGAAEPCARRRHGGGPQARRRCLSAHRVPEDGRHPPLRNQGGRTFKVVDRPRASGQWVFGPATPTATATGGSTSLPPSGGARARRVPGRRRRLRRSRALAHRRDGHRSGDGRPRRRRSAQRGRGRDPAGSVSWAAPRGRWSYGATAGFRPGPRRTSTATAATRVSRSFATWAVSTMPPPRLIRSAKIPAAQRRVVSKEMGGSTSRWHASRSPPLVSLHRSASSCGGADGFAVSLFPVASGAGALAVGDLKNNGAPDLVLGGWASGGFTVPKNRGDGMLDVGAVVASCAEAWDTAVAGLDGGGGARCCAGVRLCGRTRGRGSRGESRARRAHGGAGRLGAKHGDRPRLDGDGTPTSSRRTATTRGPS